MMFCRRPTLAVLTALIGVGLFSVGGAQEIPPPTPHLLYRALSIGDEAASSRAYRALGDPTSALSHAQAITAPTAGDLRQTAELALATRDWQAARDALRALIAAASSDGWAHTQLGLVLAADDRQAALDHLRRAESLGEPPLSALIDTLDANTDSRRLAYEVGTVLTALGYPTLAEYAFTQAAIFAPSPAEAVASVGLARALQGLDYQPWLTQAQILAPSSAEVYILSGLAHRAAGRAFDSLTAMLSAVSLAPIDPEVNAQVGEAYALLGDEQSAAFWLWQAAVLSGEDPRYTEAYQAAAAALALDQQRPPSDD